MLLIIQKSIRVLHLIAVFSRAKDKCGRTKNKKNRTHKNLRFDL